MVRSDGAVANTLDLFVSAHGFSYTPKMWEWESFKCDAICGECSILGNLDAKTAYRRNAECAEKA